MSLSKRGCMNCGDAFIDPDDVVCTRCEEEFWDSDPGVVPNTFDDEAEEDDLADPH